MRGIKTRGCVIPAIRQHGKCKTMETGDRSVSAEGWGGEGCKGEEHKIFRAGELLCAAPSLNFCPNRTAPRSAEEVLVTQTSDSLRPHGLQPTRFLRPWNSPGKNTGEGCDSLLQGIFPTQGLNLVLLHCRGILYHLSLQGSPTIATMTPNVNCGLWVMMTYRCGLINSTRSATWWGC